MSGRGGYKHRRRKLHGKRMQRRRMALAIIERVRHQFESKGQTWDPLNNPTQLAALTHDARRIVALTDYSKH